MKFKIFPRIKTNKSIERIAIQQATKAIKIHRMEIKSNPSFAKKQELYPHIKVNIKGDTPQGKPCGFCLVF